jgi:two-component system response regulator RegX3
VHVRILLVEDDRSIASPLVDGLRAAGYTVEHVTHGAEALSVAAAVTATATGATAADLVLLDLGLPDMDGRDVFRHLRTARPHMPIIMLTARGDEFDRVLGLELGADDYVTKPFSLRELIARIRAVSRRAGATPAGETRAEHSETPGRQTIGTLTIDRRTRRINVGDDEIHLTAKEFDLLSYLASEPGTVRTRIEILEHVWDAHWYGPTKTVDAHVASIRKKLGTGAWIEAVRGVGFRLEPPS